MLLQSKNLHCYWLGSFLLRNGGGGGGGDFHSGDFRFVLWIIQEAPCFIPCDYVIKEFVVSITHISIRTPEMPICISFLLGRQHSKYRMLTNTEHVQHIPCRIPRVLPTEIPTSDAVWPAYFLLSLLTTSCIRTFASFIDVDEDHDAVDRQHSRPSWTRLC
jgi:hypothetical protein